VSDAPVIAMLSNPHSGHNRDKFEAISARISSCYAIHHRVTESAEEIPAVLEELAQQKLEVLAINGGDGTIAAVLGYMLEHQIFEQPPLIALLPGGTANMTAGDIGVAGNLRRAVDSFCQWCEGERKTDGLLQRRSLLRVTTGAAETAQYGMFLGGGAIIQGTEYAHREVHSRGLRDDLSMVLSVGRTLWGLFRNDPEFNRHATIDLRLNDGPTQRHDTLILAVSTLERLAFGMRPFWAAGPGAIQITVMDQHCSKFLRTFVSIIRNRPNKNAIPEAGYFSHNTDKCELSLTDRLNLDGEIIHAAGKVTIEPSAELEFLKL
jgi:diacylglycerol kinase (ATP)